MMSSLTLSWTISIVAVAKNKKDGKVRATIRLKLKTRSQDH